MSVTLHKQSWICVLDPILMLCSCGLQGIGLTKQLGPLMELWVVRELWHILDDTPLYLNRESRLPGYGVASELFTDPALSSGSTFSSAVPSSGEASDALNLPLIEARSLQAWSKIRNITDLGGYQFYWMGDAVCQSRLPDGLKQGKTPNSRLQRYELLAQSLEASTSSDSVGVHQPLVAACRDSAALAASLGAAFILAAQRHADEPPYIVQCLERWGIPCQQRPTNDAIVDIEKKLFHQLFVQAGMAKLLWSETLPLAIVHLNVPASFDPNLVSEDHSDDDGDGPSDFGSGFGPGFEPQAERPWELENIPFAGANLWDGAQVFWYPLTHHTVMANAYADAYADNCAIAHKTSHETVRR